MTTGLCFPALCGAVLALNANGASLDTAKIEQITGLKGAWNAGEGAFKVSSPRNDVAVKVDEWKMPPCTTISSTPSRRSISCTSAAKAPSRRWRAAWLKKSRESERNAQP
jgi:hypothetical protein